MCVLPKGEIKLNRYVDELIDLCICGAVVKWTGRLHRLVGMKVSK